MVCSWGTGAKEPAVLLVAPHPLLVILIFYSVACFFFPLFLLEICIVITTSYSCSGMYLSYMFEGKKKPSDILFLFHMQGARWRKLLIPNAIDANIN